ncbi:MAG: hypothetical protein PHO63_01410 [Bacilli bacterium]|nr:hypothetical protein [Bacilli bacterium]
MNDVTVELLSNNSYLDWLKSVLTVVLFLLIIIFIINFFNNLYRYFKYGYWESTKKTSLKSKINLTLFMIKRVPGYRKIISSSKYNSDLVIIDQGGIYLFKIFNFEGIVSGKAKNKKIILQTSKDNEEFIPNPYLDLLEDEQKLLKKENKLKIKKYVVISSMCVFNVDKDNNINIISLGKVNDILKKLTKKKTYTKEEVKKYYKEFR